MKKFIIRNNTYSVISIIISVIINKILILPFWNRLGYKSNLIIIITFVSLVYYVIYVLFNIKYKDKRLKNYINKLIVIYMIFILAITYFKARLPYITFVFNPFEFFFSIKEDILRGIANFIGNLLMYIPVGMYFRHRSYKSNKELVKIFLIFIIVVEFIQGITKCGVFDTNDILTNTIGFIIGLNLYKSNKNIKR